MDDGEYISSATLWSVPSDAIELVFSAIPKDRRGKPKPTRDEIRIALAKLAKRSGTSVEDIRGIFLATRIREYYESPEGRGFYFRQPTTWLSDEGWDEPTELWSARDEKAQERERVRKQDEAIARQQAERRAQTERWKQEAQ